MESINTTQRHIHIHIDIQQTNKLRCFQYRMEGIRTASTFSYVL